MPLMVVGVVPVAATMQSVCTVSGDDDMSMVIPRELPGPFYGDGVLRIRHRAPHLLKRREEPAVALHGVRDKVTVP